MSILLNPGCHMDTIQQLLPALPPTCASHFTNSLMTCLDFLMNSSPMSTIVFSCFQFTELTFIFSMIYHSYSSLLSSCWSLYPMVLACFCNRWQKLSLSLCSCHPCPYFTSCSTLHSLFLESPPSCMGLLSAERAVSLHLTTLLYPKYPPTTWKNTRTVGRTAALFHLPLLQTHLCL